MKIRSKSALDSVDLSDVRSISVEIFDTVLLRDTWPEELQFIQVAEQWTPKFEEAGLPTVTAYELLTYRDYARQVLLKAFPDDTGNDREITIINWFAEIVRLVALKYDVKLTKRAHNDLVNKLIEIELDTETTHLKANHALANELRAAREEHGLKIVFISDMYLSTKHVTQLLNNAGLGDLFDDGITSADTGCGKYSGKLYRYVHAKDMVDLTSNVHIGDNAHSDYRAAIAEGTQAIHYKTLFHLKREIRERLGKRKLAAYHEKQRKLIREGLTDASKGKPTANRVGLAFSAPLIAYVSTFSDRAHHKPGTHFVGVSSEATVFEQTRNVLYPKATPANITMLPKLNRKAALGAVLSQAAKTPEDFPIAAANLITYGEGTTTLPEIAKFLEASPPLLLLQGMTEKERGRYFRDLVAHVDPSVSEEVSKQLALDKYKDIILLDVGWGGTIQVFLRELAALQHRQTTIGGLYIGVQPEANRFNAERGPMEGLLFDDVLNKENRRYFVPEIWEYVLSDKKQYNQSARHRSIHQSLLDSVSTWKNDVHAAPHAYWEAMKPEIERLLVAPTQQEIALLGSITFDSGFNKTVYKPLIDMSRSKPKYFLRSVLWPKKTAKEITAQYAWTRGYLHHYHLPHITLLLKIGSRIKHWRYL